MWIGFSHAVNMWHICKCRKNHFHVLTYFLYNTKIRDYSNINELPWCVRIASNNMNYLYHYCCFHKCFIQYQLHLTISVVCFIQYQFGSKNQQFFSFNLHLKTMTFIYLIKYQFLNVDYFPLITVDNCNIFLICGRKNWVKSQTLSKYHTHYPQS